MKNEGVVEIKSRDEELKYAFQLGLDAALKKDLEPTIRQRFNFLFSENDSEAYLQFLKGLANKSGRKSIFDY